MLVPLSVVPHGAALRRVLCVLQCYVNHAVLPRRRREQQLHGIHRLAHVAAAALSDILRRPRFHDGLYALTLRYYVNRTPHRGHDLGGGYGLELEHGAAGEQRVIDVEKRVLGGGGDERDAAVLYELEEALLLLFVEVLYLVEVEQHAAGREQGVELGDDVLYIR